MKKLPLIVFAMITAAAIPLTAWAQAAAPDEEETELNVTAERMEVQIDGKTIEGEGLGIMLVNFSHIQFEIPVTHDSDARDGLFDIAVLKADNAFGLIPAFIAATTHSSGKPSLAYSAA